MKNRLTRIFIAMFLCGAVLTGCGKEAVKMEEMGSMEIPEDRPIELPVERPVKVKLEGTYDRATYLADMVYEANDSRNTMVSPLSLDMALGLVSGGANGVTREELAAYLGMEDYGVFAEQYMEYAEGLNAQSDSSYYQMAYEIANSIWIKEDRKLVETYVEKARRQYDAQMEAVSFEQADRFATVEQINDWCNEKTHDLIPEIISEDSISDDAVAILLNSLYFECPWRDEWGVTSHDFTDFEGMVTEQEMLCDTLGGYYENDYATAFSKSYQNGMEFIGILPKEAGEFRLSDLDVESLLESESSKYDVKAVMPRLDFETSAGNIVDILKAQGVEAVFDRERSDLSGFIQMENDEVAYISDIIQKTKIQLDENGTKAAAVTAVMMNMATSAMPEEKVVKEVYLDRPFAFIIYDETNEQIVFMGKVVEP